MCDDFELEQDFESLEIPEVPPCDIPSSMTDYVSHTMDEIDFSSGENDELDTPLEISMAESVDSHNLDDIRLNSTPGTSFDDLEKIKQELDDELSISSHDIN